MKKILTFIMLCLITSITIKAQELVGDKPWGGEVTFGVTKKFSKRFSLEFEEELRANKNISDFYRSASTLSFEYSPYKFLKLATSYTLHLRDEDYFKHTKHIYIDTSYTQVRHRFAFQATGSYKVLNIIKLSLRERIQVTLWDKYKRIRPESTIIDTLESKKNLELRSRLQAVYSIPGTNLECYANAEVFMHLNRKLNANTNTYKDPFIPEIRYIIGLEYDFNKHHSVNAYFRYNDYRGDDVEDDDIKYLVGIGYNFTF